MADPNIDFYAAIRCLQGNKDERKACRNACTVDTCPLVLSFWSYRPSVSTNAVFAAIFGVYAILTLVLGLYSRKFGSYTAVVFIGHVMEVIGFIARIYAYSYPFSDISFIIQMVCLTLAPAFYAAGIYFSLQRIVITFSSELSRIRTKRIPQIFIACDVLSLFLQGLGGALAAWYAQQEKMPDNGNYTMIGGLSFQALTLLAFFGLAIDYGIRVWKARRMGGVSMNPELTAVQLRKSRRFKALIASLTVSGVLILFRSIYRVLELAEGWKGELMSRESYVVGLETIPVVIAAALLSAVHPGFCFRDEPINMEPKYPRHRYTGSACTDKEPLYTIRRWNEKTGRCEIEIIYDDEHPAVQNLRDRTDRTSGDRSLDRGSRGQMVAPAPC